MSETQEYNERVTFKMGITLFWAVENKRQFHIYTQRGRQRGRQRDNWNLMEKDYILRCLIVLFSILISQNLPLALFSELALHTI